MLYRPDLSSYANYGDYALAAVGYALISQGSVHMDSTRHYIDFDHGCCSSSGQGRSRLVERCPRTLVVESAGGNGNVAGQFGADFRGGLDSSSHPLDVNDHAGDSSCLPCGAEKVEDQGLRNDGLSESKTQRNRRWRQEKKERKIKKKKNQGKILNDDHSWIRDRENRIKDELRVTQEEKWMYQNRLATAEAKRRLEVLELTDIQTEAKKYSTGLRAAAERNMVSIEKTHAFLKSTGNVPGHVPQDFYGSAETVITPPLTISPDSSASMHEYRQALKRIADLEKENEEKKEECERMRLAFKKVDLTFEVADAADKETFTDTQSNQDIMDVLNPYGVIHYVKRGDKTKIKFGNAPEEAHPDAVMSKFDDEYTAAEKKEWLSRYAFVDKLALGDCTIQSIKMLSGISLAEVRKYSKFKFDLRINDQLIPEEDRN